MERPLTQHIVVGEPPLDLRAYQRVGGYQALRKALLELSPAQVRAQVGDANLRGRGGAGFPTGLKWSFVPMGDAATHPKYLVVNADEMEPGTFKDRMLLEGHPHQLIEGAIISAYAIQADISYVFVRWAYRLAQERLTAAIAEAYAAGYLGEHILGSAYSLEMSLHVSAGRYICGEETGLLNALEGKRALPRTKPPFPQSSGLWGRDTIVHNVETLCNVLHIVDRGAEWFRGLSHTSDGGTKLYGVSGKVKRSGIWELPMGTTIREILEGYAGGLRQGLELRGLLPGGASTDFLVRDHLDVKMDFASVARAGSRLGTGAIVVLDSETCPVGMVLNLERFFARESCGWCTPCRDGLPWIAKLLQAVEDGDGKAHDLRKLTRQCKLLGPGHTYCPFAPGAVEPLQSALRYFREDFEQHIRERECPWQ